MGYFQYSNSRKGQNPLHSKGGNTIEDQSTFSLVNNASSNHTKQIKDSKSVPSLINGSSLKKVKHQRHSQSKNMDISASKMIQDQFINTYSSRLSKVPSFLSTHMSKFTSSNVMNDVLYWLHIELDY